VEQLELARRRSEQRGFLTHGPEWATAKASEGEVYRQLALHWSRSSRAMANLCAGAGMQYLHFLQPNQYLPGSKPMGAEERRQALDPASPYVGSVPAGYPQLRAYGEELAGEGVAFRDLSMLFSDIDEVLYSDTCCHLNARGNELLAKEVALFIAQRWQPHAIR
jgi:hypothetical protein